MIDIAKGIGILLVVLGHNELPADATDEVHRVLFSFHMPLFFVLSGVFLNEADSLRKVAWAKGESLLKPYFVVLGTLGVVKWLLAAAAGEASFAEVGQYYLGVLWGTGSTLVWAPLWFLPNLFLALLVVQPIAAQLATRNKPTLDALAVAGVMLAIGIASIGLFFHPGPGQPSAVGTGFLPGLPWGIDLLPLSATCVLLGWALREQIRSATPRPGAAVLAAVVFVVLHALRDDAIELNRRIYGNPWVSTAEAVAGIYLVLFAAALLQTRRLPRLSLAYLGESSLFILVFHKFFQDKGFTLALNATGDRPLAMGLSFVAGVLGPLLILEITKRQRHLAMLLLPRKTWHTLVSRRASAGVAEQVAKHAQSTK